MVNVLGPEVLEQEVLGPKVLETTNDVFDRVACPLLSSICATTITKGENDNTHKEKKHVRFTIPFNEFHQHYFEVID